MNKGGAQTVCFGGEYESRTYMTVDTTHYHQVTHKHRKVRNVSRLPSIMTLALYKESISYGDSVVFFYHANLIRN